MGVHGLLIDITWRGARPVQVTRPAIVYLPLLPASPPVITSDAPALIAPSALPNEAFMAVPAPIDAPRRTARNRRAAVMLPAPAFDARTDAAPTTEPHEPVSAAAQAASAAAGADTPTRRLDLGADVMRAAARESKSSVRRATEASGQTLRDAPRSSSDALAASVARAGKPDCLGPNEGGGGLLSVFMIAAAALQDKCR